MELQQESQLSDVVVALFKGVIYRDNNEKLWGDILNLHNAIIDYVGVLNLELILDEAEGFAFLKSKPDSEEKTYPRLIARRSLTFEVSLLLALLRKSLVEFDSDNADVRFILSQSQLIDLMKTYLGDTTNQVKLADKIEGYINKVVELGFLQKLKSQQSEPHYEVKRILKAFIDVEWLQQFNQWLEVCLANRKGGKDE
ncbi:hypothetical protein BMT54_09335 [Pasteurellaceae bacterium 15-036681]|nr:hypothetical protein BMT54_09335 [Pasteurellaceae bacterium 15-036681]